MTTKLPILGHEQDITHDAFFRLSMGNLRIATDWFHAHLPKKISSTANWDTLKVEPDSFVGRYQNHLADMLYSVEVEEEQAYLYLLCEHKASAERLLPLQIYRYLAEIWQMWLKQQRKAKQSIEHLPLIWPAIFYHGEQRPYPFSTDIRDCFANRELAGELFDRPYHLVDLSVYSDEQLKDHGLAAGFEMIQKHIFDRDNWQFYQDFVQQVLKTVAQELGDEYLISLVNYAIDKGELDNVDNFLKLLATTLPENEDTFMTMRQQLEQRGEQRGLQQGIELTAYNALKSGADVEFVAKITGLTIDQVNILKAKIDSE